MVFIARILDNVPSNFIVPVKIVVFIFLTDLNLVYREKSFLSVRRRNIFVYRENILPCRETVRFAPKP